MTVQAPLIYAYPLREWLDTAAMVLESKTKVRVTRGQRESIIATGGAGAWSLLVSIDPTSSAIKEVF